MSARETAAFAPARALMTPTWIVAAIVLGINDHLLKGADLLPDVVTGKLSDIAGMFVAPALLAALVGARRSASAGACYLAVGVVFTAINLSPEAATLWAETLAHLGVGWVTTCDPTDVLVALPSLLLAWWRLGPRPRRLLPAVRPRRVLELASACVGVLLCVATSPRREVAFPEPVPEFVPPRSATGVTIATRQAVAGHIELRCTDGARVELPFAMEEPLHRNSWVIFEPAPGPGVECKIKVLGLPGSYGPVTASTPLVWCEVSPGSPLRCEPG